MVSNIQLSEGYRCKQYAREQLATETYHPDFCRDTELLRGISQIPFARIYDNLTRRDLSYEEAFVGACYALRASNRVFAEGSIPFWNGVECSNFEMVGREFLSAMGVKEAHKGVTAEEVAGMVRAVGLDLIFRFDDVDRIFENCGTGGDIGFPPREKPKKLINLSTLASFIIASLGIKTMKHGSYANTSAVGSTDCIERFGAIVEQVSVSEITQIFSATGYYFADAHVFKTIHDLSHLPPRHETINHLLGPMTPPIAARVRLDKVMGVNEKVHPKTVALGFEKLHECGAQCIGNVAVVTGLDTDIDPRKVLERKFVQDHAILDELSPYSSVVAFVRDGQFAGSFLMHPNDFGLSFEHDGVALENKPDILHQGNIRALTGKDSRLADYLAMNAALGLFVVKYLSLSDALHPTNGPDREMLVHCFRKCRTAIAEGMAWDLLQKYVTETGGTFIASI